MTNAEALIWSAAPATEAVVIAPLTPAEAARSVAGVSHLSRALIAAAGEGAARAVVELPGFEAIRRRVEDELQRAKCAIEVVWSSGVQTATQGAARGLGDWRALRSQVLRATSKASDGLVSRTLNRPVSRWMTRWVLEIPGARPWHLTVVTAVIAAAMFAALCLGGAWGLVVGGLLFQTASVVDGVDGEMARATFRSSRAGAAFDTTVDMATNLLFTLGVTIGLTRLHGSLYAWVGGVAFVLFLAGVGALGALVRIAAEGPSFDLLKTVYARRFNSGFLGGGTTVVRIITSRDFFALSFALLAVVGLGWTIPWLMLAGTAGWWLIIAGAVPWVIRAAAARKSGAVTSSPAP